MAFAVVAGIVGLALSFPMACASPGAAAHSASADVEPDVESGVDPQRAHLALARIEPSPARPVRPEALNPPSDRAAGQIAKARSLVAQQRYTEAAIELERALRYDPGHPEIHRTLALLHWEAGNIERARSHAGRALDGNPDDAVAWYLTGRCHAQDGDNAAAVQAFRTALLCSNFSADRSIAALCRFHLANALASDGYLVAALEQYDLFETSIAKLDESATNTELATVTGAGRASVGVKRSELLESLNRFSEAADALALAASQSSADIEAQLRYGRLLLEARRLDEALAAVRAIDSDDEAVFDLLFQVYERLGRPERIIEDLRSRVAMRPDDSGLTLRLADMLVRLDRSDEARVELERHLDKHGELHQVRLRLVDLLLAESAWTGALEVCSEGIRLDPHRTQEYEDRLIAAVVGKAAVDVLLSGPLDEFSPHALYLRGAIGVAAERYAGAERFLVASLQRASTYVPARVRLARLYFRDYRYEEAIGVAGRTDESRPEDARLELLLGEIYERLDKLDQAAVHLQAAIQLDRGDTRAMLALASLHRRNGEKLQAQRQLRVLLGKDPDDEAARELLAYIYLEDGKLDVALEQMRELQRRAKSPTTKARAGALLEQVNQGGVEAYRRTLLEAMEQNAPDAETWLAIAESHGAEREQAARLDAFLKALAVDPNNEEAAIGAANAAQLSLEYEQAVELLQPLLLRRPNRHRWRLALVDLLTNTQDYDGALALAREAKSREDLDEGHRDRYRRAILDTLQRAGRSDEGLAQLIEWTEAEPDQPHWSIFLAQEYLARDRAGEAVSILKAMFEKSPDDADARLRLVRALTAAKQYDRASQHILDWLNEDPDNDRAHAELAGVLSQADRLDEAEELVQNRLLRTLRREHFQNLLVMMLQTGERYDDAVEWIDALLEEVTQMLGKPPAARMVPAGDEQHDDRLSRLPDEPFSRERLHDRMIRLRMERATVLIAGKEYDTAEKELSTWLEQSRDPAIRFDCLIRLSFCVRAMGEESRAGEFLIRALGLRPDEPGLNNDVAYGWIDKGERLDEAERMIRFSLSRGSRNGAYLDTYGWLLYKKGLFEEARTWLLRASRADRETDSVVLDHLGDACWRLGRRDEAVEFWKAAGEGLRDRPADELASDDERRAQRATASKIEAVQEGREPEVAPLPAAAADDDGDAEAGE